MEHHKRRAPERNLRPGLELCHQGQGKNQGQQGQGQGGTRIRPATTNSHDTQGFHAERLPAIGQADGRETVAIRIDDSLPAKHTGISWQVGFAGTVQVIQPKRPTDTGVGYGRRR